MTKFYITALFIVTLYSCQTQQKFDKGKWMVDDLTKSIPLKGESYQDIVSLLGQPQYPIDSTMEIGYKIVEEYGSDIDPMYTQTFLLQFNKDSTVNSFQVKEWKK